MLQVDVGDAGKKQVCAGLKGKYEVAELIGKSVIILLNLKPAEFKASNPCVLRSWCLSWGSPLCLAQLVSWLGMRA